jgi:hypothetical protein
VIEHPAILLAAIGRLVTLTSLSAAYFTLSARYLPS